MRLLKYYIYSIAVIGMLSGCGGDDDAQLTGDGAQESPDKPKVTKEDDGYYDWDITESRQIAPGVNYTCYTFRRFPQRIHVVDADLSDPAITIETSIADEYAPNPNANGNHNNGPCLRETLRENVLRKRSEGHNIVAGTNSGFGDSHEGIPRGIHVQNGEMVYMNNPNVRRRLVNHVWGLAYFTDRSISFEDRVVSGNVRLSGETFEYFSINDTITRLRGKVEYDANVYTRRLVSEPHPGIYNPVSPDALFIVAKGSGPITVNTGYQQAVITDIIDGRNSAVGAPFVTDEGEWVLQVIGSKADRIAALANVGDKIEIECSVTVGGKKSLIDVYNASMFYYVRGGDYVAPPASYADVIYQTMNAGTDASRKKFYLFAIDGVKIYRGLDYYEAARVAMKLGITDVIRFDSGGSVAMWVLDSNGGDVVNNITDSYGERSCLNYLHIVRK